MLRYFNRSVASKKLNRSYVQAVSLQNQQSKDYEKFKGFNNTAMQNLQFKKQGVTIVRDLKSAEKALEVLKSIPSRVHAWDTETIDLEVKEVSPVGNGKILSAQAFCGPDIDFGTGPRLFIDNFGENFELIQMFKEYFEDDKYLKSWFNYGFDRHIFYNHGINVRGFGGDSMHMGRLIDPSRGPKEYSLSSLSRFYEKDIQGMKKEIIKNLRKKGLNSSEEMTLKLYETNFLNQDLKTNMKTLFARQRVLANGQLGKTLEMPSLIELHTDPEFLPQWIDYATLDAEVTFFLREVLVKEMMKYPTQFESCKNIFDLYCQYWLPFGELLTDIEREGIRVNQAHLQAAEIQALKDIEDLKASFIDFVRETQEDAYEFNPSSTQQLQQLLFAPFKRNQKMNDSRKEKMNRIGGSGSVTSSDFSQFDDSQGYNSSDFASNHDGDVEFSLEDPKTSNKKNSIGKDQSERNIDVMDDFPIEREFKVENTRGIIEPGAKTALKSRTMKIRGLGLKPPVLSASGLPSVDVTCLNLLAGDPPNNKFGTAYDHFKSLKQEEKGKKLCWALHNLQKHRGIETLVNTFIRPLQELADSNSRVHCSLNINTETGRLSSRKPNLQNQPALDKDQYKVRKGFEPEKGNKFIVADYGQLELRILAHMTNCKEMIEAFKSGGDFHSRTAVSMFDYIKKDIENGDCLLEWDYSKGQPPAKLVKDKYAVERKQAKMMNFSIAYGKSAHGFSKDWGCSLEEAQDVLDAWYKQRPEVKKWQEQAKETAIQKGWTRTLTGRYRNLTKHFKTKNKMHVMHGLRAAINTPIQGGAADIMVGAMKKLWMDQRLREMSWKMVHQVHDEIILEGPEKHAEEALKILRGLMENPMDEAEFLLPMEVDASICDNWYDA